MSTFAGADSQQAPAVAPAEPPAHTVHGGLRARWANVSLLWRVFAVNAVICVVAFALLAWAPVTVHRVATPSELLILSIGLAAMLIADLILLRRVFGPLRRLAAMMAAVDPLNPGRRADTPRAAGREVVALAEALNSMLDRLEDERRESGRRALAAQEGERARIARELHDEVGQTLTAVALRAERAAAQPDSAQQQEALGAIAQTVLHSLDDVRRLGRELRPEALDDLGLVGALVALCRRVEAQGALTVERKLDAQLPELPGEVELVIYRVAQEALTNAMRHSDSERVAVSLERTDGSVTLRVRDEGVGLPSVRNEGGIAGMRERAMLIGAELSVGAREPRGTEVVLSVPAGP